MNLLCYICSNKVRRITQNNKIEVIIVLYTILTFEGYLFQAQNYKYPSKYYKVRRTNAIRSNWNFQLMCKQAQVTTGSQWLALPLNALYNKNDLEIPIWRICCYFLCFIVLYDVSYFAAAYGILISSCILRWFSAQLLKKSLLQLVLAFGDFKRSYYLFLIHGQATWQQCNQLLPVAQDLQFRAFLWALEILRSSTCWMIILVRCGTPQEGQGGRWWGRGGWGQMGAGFEAVIWPDLCTWLFSSTQQPPACFVHS